MSTNIWQIRLRPLEPFYFGGANHFSAGSDKNKVNYRSKSNYFPQQTALLGMLRYQLLAQEGLIPLSNNNRGTAKKLVGADSFFAGQDEINVANNSEQTDNQTSLFGKIMRLSPVFIQEIQSGTDGNWVTTKRIYRDSLEHFDYNNEPTQLTLLKGAVKVSFDRNVWQDYTPPIAPFSGKTTPEPNLIDWKSGNRIPFDYDKDKKEGVFIKDWRTGIVKKDREEAFYRQCFYRFADLVNAEYCFAFYAELDDSVTLAANAIVQLGGDRSAFAFSANKVEKNNPITTPEVFYKDLFEHKGDRSCDKLVLLSDTRVDANLFSLLRFASIKGQNFRNNRASIQQTMQYGPLAAKERSIGALLARAEGLMEVPYRDQPYYLMAAGSVLYSDNIEAVKKAIDRFNNFKNIGYNHYLFIPKI